MEDGDGDVGGAEDSDTGKDETNATEDAEAEDAEPEEVEAEGAEPEDAEPEGEEGEVGGRDGPDGREGFDGLGGLGGLDERPGAGREAVPAVGADAVSEAAEALPGAEAEVEAEAGAETGAKAVAEVVAAAVDGLDAGPHAEAWPSGRAIAPSPMSSPVARSVVTRSHGVTSESLTMPGWWRSTDSQEH